jgi:DNA topoisomerase-1
MANLEAAKICNHRRSVPRTWESTLDKKKQRLKLIRKRAKAFQVKIQTQSRLRKTKYNENLQKKEKALEEMNQKLSDYKQQIIKKQQQGRSVKSLEKRIILKQKAIKQQKLRIKNFKIQHKKQMNRLDKRLTDRKKRDNIAIDKQRYKIKLQKETRDYNLTTSLKSYIDPRIFLHWGRKYDYDWKKYYSKTLQKKFSWVEANQDS